MLYEQVDTAVIDGESLPWVPLTPYTEDDPAEVLQA